MCRFMTRARQQSDKQRLTNATWRAELREEVRHLTFIYSGKAGAYWSNHACVILMGFITSGFVRCLFKSPVACQISKRFLFSIYIYIRCRCGVQKDYISMGFIGLCPSLGDCLEEPFRLTISFIPSHFYHVSTGRICEFLSLAGVVTFLSGNGAESEMSVVLTHNSIQYLALDVPLSISRTSFSYFIAIQLAI